MEMYISVASLLGLGAKQKQLAAELNTRQATISTKREDGKCFVRCEVSCEEIVYSDNPLFFVQHPNVSDKERRAFVRRGKHEGAGK